MAQSEERLYLLRHICEGGRDAGLQLGCRFRVIALAKFVLTSGNEECLLGTETTLFDRGPTLSRSSAEGYRKLREITVLTMNNCPFSGGITVVPLSVGFGPPRRT